MKLSTWIKNNWRSVFYSLSISLGLLLLIAILENEPINFFYLGSGVLFLLLISEIAGVWFWSTKKLVQMNIPIVDEKDHLIQLVLHVTLPSMLYWSLVGFIYNNLNPHLWKLVISVAGIIFYILFTNIRGYYEDKFKLEQKTHYVYDFIKFFVYFLVVFSIISLVSTGKLTPTFGGIYVGLVGLILIGINLIGYKKFELKYLLGSILGGITLMLIGGISVYFLNFFKALLINVLFFYMIIGVLHHLMQKDLTRDVVLEYLLVALLLSAMFVF